MKFLVAHNGRMFGNEPIETYARSMIRVLREKGHEVVETVKKPLFNVEVYRSVDYLLDIDCGRDERGLLRWHAEHMKPPCKSIVYFIDSHGYPDDHKRLAPRYDHVFFAVWNRRDLFAKHPSAHWSPNFTDKKWFDKENLKHVQVHYDFGFFGSKGGLDRAYPMRDIAESMGCTYRIAQVRKPEKPRWPYTAEAMRECNYLFNHGQKHDGPNLRVMESMMVGRPLITDVDATDGMGKLFTPYKHFVPYGEFKDGKYSHEGLKEAMLFCRNNPVSAGIIANNAYQEVKSHHLVENRIDQILEVVS